MKLETRVESDGDKEAFASCINRAQHLGLRQPAAAFARQPCCRRTLGEMESSTIICEAKPIGVRRQQGWLEEAAAGLRAVQGAARFCFVIVFTLALASAADVPPHTFIWRDGSSLSGRITSATADSFTIESSVFAEPLVLDSSVISEVQLGRGAKAEPEPFLFSLKEGGIITGSIASITEKQVTVRNRTLGELIIPAGDLLSIQKAGPHDLDTADNFFASASKPPALAVTPPPAANPAPAAKPAIPASGLFQPVRLPERCDIVLKMRTQPKPAFRVVITGANSQRVTIEAKNGDLVLQGRVFSLIKNINTVDGAVNLHLYWNQRTGQCALCTSAGVVIAETNKGPVGTIVASDSQGILIQNAVPNFAIAYLGTNSWDGLMPLSNELDGPGVVLSDDTAIKGRVVATDDNSIYVRGPDGRQLPVPVAKVVRIRFVPDRSTPSKVGKADAWFADGTRLDGRITGIRDGMVTFETPQSAKALSFPITVMRHMQYHQSADVVKTGEKDQRSRLQIKDRVLFGELADGTQVVHWKPTGAKNAVPLAADVEFSITRPAVSETADGVVFHLSDGEVISGKLTGMTGKEIEGEWAFGAPFKLPAQQVRAIQFPADRVQLKGFSSETWVPSAEDRGAASLKDNEALLSGVASISHPDVMRAGQIQFTWQPESSYAQLELTMFQAEPKPSASGVLVRLHFSSNRLQVLMTRPEVANRYTTLGSYFAEAGKPLKVLLDVSDDAVSMRVNDFDRMLIPAENAKRAGNAMTLTLRQSSGLVILNNLRLQNGQQINPQVIQRLVTGKPIRIWDFAATTDANHLRPAGGVNEAVRLEALQIPRFRRDAQPKQILVAANRDLLRGEVEALAADHLLFRTGLETVKVPLSRLAAIMTPLPVKPPEEAAEKKEAAETSDEPADDANPLLPAAASGANDSDEPGKGSAEPPAVFVSLSTGGRVRLALEAVRDGVVTGRHPNIGPCRIPLNLVSCLSTSTVTDQLASRALEGCWRWEHAPEPVIPETGGQSSLALGKEAPAFKLPLLGGGDFDLAEEKGKVVVLDFWATWCGPCVKSLPDLTKAMADFPADKLQFIGVNQGEGGEVVKRFLEMRGIKMTVAMDGAQSVARQYGVDGIPHTVIIDKEGKVAWEKTGFSSDGARDAAAAVTRLLGGK